MHWLISNTSLPVLNEMLLIRAGINKTLVRIANREDPVIRLLLLKQSDFGLHWLSRPFDRQLV